MLPPRTPLPPPAPRPRGSLRAGPAGSSRGAGMPAEPQRAAAAEGFHWRRWNSGRARRGAPRRAAGVGGGDYFLAAQGSREGGGVIRLLAQASGRHYSSEAVRERWRCGVSCWAGVGSAAGPPSASVHPAGSLRAEGRRAAGWDAVLRQLQVDGGGMRCLLSSYCAFVYVCMYVCI